MCLKTIEMSPFGRDARLGTQGLGGLESGILGYAGIGPIGICLEAGAQDGRDWVDGLI